MIINLSIEKENQILVIFFSYPMVKFFFLKISSGFILKKVLLFCSSWKGFNWQWWLEGGYIRGIRNQTTWTFLGWNMTWSTERSPQEVSMLWFYSMGWREINVNSILKKELLLIDNLPGHIKDLTEMYNEINIIFMPANTTFILQPMN